MHAPHIVRFLARQVFLLNLLVAQLNGAYASVYDDMVGYARLTRGSIIAGTSAQEAEHSGAAELCLVTEVRSFEASKHQVTALEGVSANRWQRFLSSLRFEARSRLAPIAGCQRCQAFLQRQLTCLAAFLRTPLLYADCC